MYIYRERGSNGVESFAALQQNSKQTGNGNTTNTGPDESENKGDMNNIDVAIELACDIYTIIWLCAFHGKKLSYALVSI